MTTQIDFRTLPVNVPVLCIPRVYANISEQRIRRIFVELNMGTLERIDIVGKHSGKGENFNRVYVHFRCWNDSENACIARERLLNGKEIKIIYDDPWFWKISAYRATERKTEKSYKPTLHFDSDEDRRRPPREQPRDDTRRPPRKPHYDNRRHPKYDRRTGDQELVNNLTGALKNPRSEAIAIEDNPDTNSVDQNIVINYGDITVPKRRKILKKQPVLKIEDEPTTNKTDNLEKEAVN